MLDCVGQVGQVVLDCVALSCMSGPYTVYVVDESQRANNSVESQHAASVARDTTIVPCVAKRQKISNAAELTTATYNHESFELTKEEYDRYGQLVGLRQSRDIKMNELDELKLLQKKIDAWNKKTKRTRNRPKLDEKLSIYMDTIDDSMGELFAYMKKYHTDGQKSIKFPPMKFDERYTPAVREMIHKIHGRILSHTEKFSSSFKPIDEPDEPAQSTQPQSDHAAN